MKKLSFIFILFGSVIFASACSQPGVRHGGQESLTDAKDTLPYQIDTFTAISPYFQQVDGVLDTTYFRMVYPAFADTAMQRLVFGTVMQEGETPESLSEAFLTGYQNYVEEAQYPDHVHAWFQDMSLNLPLYLPRVAVVKHHFAEYTGGAHGNYATLYHNFDLRDRSKITLDKLIDPNKRDKLISMAEKYFRISEGLSEDASLENDYFFDHGAFSLTDNFALDEKGLRFHYNIYEIKAYADGTTEFVIPYEQLQAVLSDYGQNMITYILTQGKK